MSCVDSILLTNTNVSTQKDAFYNMLLSNWQKESFKANNMHVHTTKPDISGEATHPDSLTHGTHTTVSQPALTLRIQCEQYTHTTVSQPALTEDAWRESRLRYCSMSVLFTLVSHQATSANTTCVVHQVT